MAQILRPLAAESGGADGRCAAEDVRAARRDTEGNLGTGRLHQVRDSGPEGLLPGAAPGRPGAERRAAESGECVPPDGRAAVPGPERQRVPRGLGGVGEEVLGAAAAGRLRERELREADDALLRTAPRQPGAHLADGRHGLGRETARERVLRGHVPDQAVCR